MYLPTTQVPLELRPAFSCLLVYKHLLGTTYYQALCWELGKMRIGHSSCSQRIHSREKRDLF